MGRENAVSIAFLASTRTRPAVGKGLGGSGGRAGTAALPALAVRCLALSFLPVSTEDRSGNAGCLRLTRQRATFNWGCLRKSAFAYLLAIASEKSKRSELVVEGSAGMCLPGFAEGKLGMNRFPYKIKKSFIPHRFSCFPA